MSSSQASVGGRGRRLRPARTPSVPALQRGLAILELVASSRHGLTFSQIVRHFEFPKSSVHCLLVTFEREGYLQRDAATGRYMNGLKLVGMANLALEGTMLRDRAAPLLRRLMSATGMTVHMAVLERDEIVIVAKVSRPGDSVATWLGKRVDPHCTSVGKCLIAYLPEEDLDRLVARRGLLRHNENTIVSSVRLKEELARTRARDYAMDDEEEEIGVRCIGAPIRDWSGRVIAAVSVAGRTTRINEQTCDALAAQVRQTALAISQQLGALAREPLAMPAGA